MLPKPISKLKTGRNRIYLLPIVCASGLLLVCGMMMSPISSIRQLGISGDAYADITVSGGGNIGTTTTPASVSMVFDDNTVTNEQVDVVADTPVASEAKYFTITPSGSVEKYSIYVQTSSSSNGSLVASNANNNATIATLADKTTGVPLSNLGTNTWGYALSTGRQATSSMLYKGLSGSTNAISAYDSAANPTSAQDFTLAFAANIGTDKPADHYVANVLVSVAANPGEVTGTLSDLTYMQQLTSAICKSSSPEETGELIDNRDGKKYRVAKLKDDNCWMVQNLDYDDPGTPAANRFTKATGVSGWTSTDASYRAYYDPGGPTTGNYYSFQAATNGTGSSATTDGANASGSICPTNWKLPTSKVTTSGSFAGLTNGLNFTSIQISPYYFVAGGNVNSGKLSYAGSYGYYWSSTARSGTNAYFLGFDSSTVAPSGTNGRYVGMSVRCLVQGS